MGIKFNKEKIKEIVQKNPQAVIIWTVLISFSLYVLFGTSLKIWIRILFSVILLLMGFELVARATGKPSIIEGIQDTMADTMDNFNEDLNKSMEGFDFKEPKVL